MTTISKSQFELTDSWSLWRNWIVANAFGEFIGLGGTALIGIILFTRIEAMAGSVVVALLVILAGTLLEGSAVGFVQWWTIREVLPRLRWQRWVVATATGAFVAWLLGMIPSTLMGMSELEGSGSTTFELSNGIVYGMAGVMGLVLGPILGIPQWWVLRAHLPRAGWWIVANALAWMVGMVMVFVGANAVPENELGLTAVFTLLITLLLAGAAVGAIHGLWLIWLLNQKDDVMGHAT